MPGNNKFLKLKDICKITMGQSPESSSYNQEGIGLPFFQGCSDFGEVHPTVHSYCSDAKKTARAEDILISVRAPIGSLNIADQESCIGRGLAAITPLPSADKDYIYYLLQSKKQYLQTQGTGSTFKAISKSVLEDMVIPDIGLKLQTIIGSQLRLIDKILSGKRSQCLLLDSVVKSRFGYRLIKCIKKYYFGYGF